MARSWNMISIVLFAFLLSSHANADQVDETRNGTRPFGPKRMHFVLVHGISVGAWEWYKLIPTLERAGHNVTAIDLGASGRRSQNLTDLNGYPDYVQPLVDVIENATEKVILVGHSFGGIALAWVTELFPQKILVNVFVAALMPDTTNNGYYTVQQLFARYPPGYLVDTQMNNNCANPRLNPTSLFGPIDLRTKIYQRSSQEDIALVLTLIREGPLCQLDLSSTRFTQTQYGSVPRVYILSTQDKLVLTSYQREMIRNFPPREVKEILADHSPLASAPAKLLIYLLDIANRC